MHMRYRFFMTVLVLVVLSLRAPNSVAADPAGTKPNVILILTDDQGYGDFSCHGNPVLRTPHLDRLPAYQGVDGDFPAGLALPIAKARVKLGPLDLTMPVDADARTVTFAGQLPRGKTQLQTWFYDPAGQELCGAFYVEVLRK